MKREHAKKYSTLFSEKASTQLQLPMEECLSLSSTPCPICFQRHAKVKVLERATLDSLNQGVFDPSSKVRPLKSLATAAESSKLTIKLQCGSRRVVLRKFKVQSLEQIEISIPGPKERETEKQKNRQRQKTDRWRDEGSMGGEREISMTQSWRH